MKTTTKKLTINKVPYIFLMFGILKGADKLICLN